jgi:hypothetical protein
VNAFTRRAIAPNNELEATPDRRSGDIQHVPSSSRTRFAPKSTAFFEFNEAGVLEARTDKPITKLRTTITNQEDVIVPDGTALVYTEPL